MERQRLGGIHCPWSNSPGRDPGIWETIGEAGESSGFGMVGGEIWQTASCTRMEGRIAVDGGMEGWVDEEESGDWKDM